MKEMKDAKHTAKEAVNDAKDALRPFTSAAAAVADAAVGTGAGRRTTIVVTVVAVAVTGDATGQAQHGEHGQECCEFHGVPPG